MTPRSQFVGGLLAWFFAVSLIAFGPDEGAARAWTFLAVLLVGTTGLVVALRAYQELKPDTRK
jgi:hypothetical protein